MTIPSADIVHRGEHSLAGILTWYSTIHLPPADLDRVLSEFRRLLTSSGVLVAGFFDSDDDVVQFDHKVIAAYRWPVDVFAEQLVKAGFTEVQRLQQQFPDRPDRKYAAIAAHAVDSLPSAVPVPSGGARTRRSTAPRAGALASWQKTQDATRGRSGCPQAERAGPRTCETEPRDGHVAADAGHPWFDLI